MQKPPLDSDVADTAPIDSSLPVRNLVAVFVCSSAGGTEIIKDSEFVDRPTTRVPLARGRQWFA